MSIYVKHNGTVKSAIPYVKHNGSVKIPTSGWAKTGGALKQIWPDDEIIIYNQATLEAFRDRVNAGETSLNARVIADFTLSGEWTPIANYASNTSLQYTGTFDGGGHTITGLTINSSSECQGLFGYIGMGGTVKDLKLASVSVTGVRYVGAVVGYSYGTVTDCTNEGDVTATDSSRYVGGVVGYSSGTVENCINSGNVSGGYNAGGIVGYNDGTVQDCTNSATVYSSNNFIGGIVGGNSTIGTVQNCTNSGNVSGGDRVGGIVGYNYNTVSGNTNEGDVTATSSSGCAGGIVGYNHGGTASNNTNTGDVSGTYAGGIVGYNHGGTASNNTNTGTVTGVNITTV